jgi:hypothetical protein
LIDLWKNLSKFVQKPIILVLFGPFWPIFARKKWIFDLSFLQPKWPFLALFCCFSEKIAILPPYDHVILEPFFAVLVAVFAKMTFFRFGVRLVAVFEKKPKFGIFSLILVKTFLITTETFWKFSRYEEGFLMLLLRSEQCFY